MEFALVVAMNPWLGKELNKHALLALIQKLVTILFLRSGKRSWATPLTGQLNFH
jgi:hypothetical protein